MYKRYKLTPAEGEAVPAATTVKTKKKRAKSGNKAQGNKKNPAKRRKVATASAGAEATKVAANAAPPKGNAGGAAVAGKPEGSSEAPEKWTEEEKVAFELVGFARNKNPNQTE